MQATSNLLPSHFFFGALLLAPLTALANPAYTNLNCQGASGTKVKVLAPDYSPAPPDYPAAVTLSYQGATARVDNDSAPLTGLHVDNRALATASPSISVRLDAEGHAFSLTLRSTGRLLILPGSTSQSGQAAFNAMVTGGGALTADRPSEYTSLSEVAVQCLFRWSSGNAG